MKQGCLARGRCGWLTENTHGGVGKLYEHSLGRGVLDELAALGEDLDKVTGQTRAGVEAQREAGKTGYRESRYAMKQYMRVALQHLVGS